MNFNYVLTVKCSHELVDLLSVTELDEMVEYRVIFGEVMGSISCLKVIRPSGSSLESVQGGPGEILKFSFSKTHISRIL